MPYQDRHIAEWAPGAQAAVPTQNGKSARSAERRLMLAIALSSLVAVLAAVLTTVR